MSDVIRNAITLIYNAINTGDLSRIGEVMTGDIIDHEEMPGIEGMGMERFRNFVSTFRAAIPDLKIVPEDMLVEGDKAAVRFTMSGTQTGELLGIPPTGKAFSIEGIDIMHFRDGKCREHWGVSDQMSMMAQLGLMPS